MTRTCLLLLLLSAFAPGQAAQRPTKPAAEADWQPLFKNDDLSGWEGLMKHWTLKNGVLVGTHTPRGQERFKTFLCSKKKFKDFEIKFQVRLKARDDLTNGGLNFRSRLLDRDRFVVAGPQADLGKGLWGCLLKETGEDRPGANPSTVVKRAPAEVAARVKQDDFNDCYVKCVGKHVTLKLNGETTVDDDFEWVPAEGILAWQIFFNTTEVTYRNILIREFSAGMPDLKPIQEKKR